MTLTKYKLTRAANGAEVILLPKMTIGRLDECELQLMASGASRRHAILTVENGQLWLEDLKSANGTYINEQRLEGKQQLKAGDHFRIDVEEFIIIDAAPPVEEVPVAKKVEATKAAVAPAEEKSNPGGTVPGAWASSDNAGGEEGRTAFIARKDLQGELESLGLADAKPIKVDVPTLLVHTGYHAGQRFELHLEKTSRAEWSVGSDSGRSIFLTDVGVSALHAVIAAEGSRWKLIDKMSANGTFVNGRAAPTAYLSPGDQISFGPVKCAFLSPEDSSSAETQTTRKLEEPTNKSNKGLMIGLISFGITLVIVGVLVLLRK